MRRQSRTAHPAGDARNDPRVRRRALRRAADCESVPRAPLPLLPGGRPTPRNRSGATGTNRHEHLAALDAEVENLHAALRWAVDQDNADPALELCAALGEYFLHRDRFADVAHWIDQVLSRPGGDPALRVRVLCIESWALWPLARRTEHFSVMAEAEALARTLPDTAILARVLCCRAVQESWDARPDVVAALADEARSCAIAAGDQWTIAMAAWARAQSAATPAELRERVERAAALLDAVGNATTWRTSSTWRPTGRCATVAIATCARVRRTCGAARARTRPSLPVDVPPW